MKTIVAILPIVILLACKGPVLAAQSDENLVQRLRKDMIEMERPEDQIVPEIAAANPEQRRRMLAAVLQITNDAFKSPQPRSDVDGNLIVASAHLLMRVSDDETTLAAFGSRLNDVEWPSLSSVIGALTTCRDPRAVEAMADFARLRLKEISSWPVGYAPNWTEEQKWIAGNRKVNFLVAVKGLANSANPSGKVIARELRDKFVKFYDGSQYRDAILRMLETDIRIDPILRGTSPSAVPKGSVPATTSSRFPKQPQQSKNAKPTSVTLPSEKQGSSGMGMAIAVAIVSVVLLGVLIWFLRRK